MEAEDDSSPCFSSLYKIRLLLPILFLFLNGIAAQESQAEIADQKLDRLLAGQELQETAEWADKKRNNALSQLRDRCED